MEIVDTLYYISLIFNTYLSCPQVHVHMLSDVMLKIQLSTNNGTIMDVYKFPKPLIWPANISITIDGNVEIQLKKLTQQSWEMPFASKVINSYDVPDLWPVQVISNEPLSHDSSLLSLVQINKVYNHIYPGQYYQISSNYNGKDRFYTFMPLPSLPIKTLNYPNPGPGRFHSTSEGIRFMAKSFPQDTFSGWLSRKTLGATLHLSKPVGEFCPVDHLSSKSIYIITSGAGLKESIPLMLFLLQASETMNVTMIMFCRSERDVLWLGHYNYILRLTDYRFKYKIILSHAGKYWRGNRGRPHYSWLIRTIPLANETDFSTKIFVSGKAMFCNLTRGQLMEKHMYPEERVFYFDKYELIPEVLTSQRTDDYETGIQKYQNLW